MMCYFNAPFLQTEFVEGEELDHRIRSRINLVDLAGSERCSAAGTIGERLKVTHPSCWGAQVGAVFLGDYKFSILNQKHPSLNLHFIDCGLRLKKGAIVIGYNCFSETVSRL